MKTRMYFLRVVIISLIVIAGVSSATSREINDSDALQGITASRTLFDINLSEPKKLELYLQVIKMTYDDIVRQGRHPDFVITFRGPAVRLIQSETRSFSDEDQQSLSGAAAMLHELKESGVRMEACSIATNLFNIDNEALLPEIKVVGNTFVSLMAYQTKGYALVPIQ